MHDDHLKFYASVMKSLPTKSFRSATEVHRLREKSKGPELYPAIIALESGLILAKRKDADQRDREKAYTLICYAMGNFLRFRYEPDWYAKFRIRKAMTTSLLEFNVN